MIFELFAKRLFPQAFNYDLSELEPKHIFLRKSVNHLGFKFGLTMLLIIIFLGIFGPHIIGISPYEQDLTCLLYTSPSPRDRTRSRMPSSA